MSQQSHKTKLILASSSPYRKSLLERLGIPFTVCPPEVDETPHHAETAAELVSRLARSKATHLAARWPGAVIIGSDQVAICENEIVGKPHSAENARAQLRRFCGRSVLFLTAICVFRGNPAFRFERTVNTEACFRDLDNDEIHRYIELDQPLDCAGSFKSEKAGISLLSSLKSDDPTAIVGLPLIALAEALRSAGVRIP